MSNSTKQKSKTKPTAKGHSVVAVEVPNPPKGYEVDGFREPENGVDLILDTMTMKWIVAQGRTYKYFCAKRTFIKQSFDFGDMVEVSNTGLFKNPRVLKFVATRAYGFNQETRHQCLNTSDNSVTLWKFIRHAD